jgi:hypothetical protein
LGRWPIAEEIAREQQQKLGPDGQWHPSSFLIGSISYFIVIFPTFFIIVIFVTKK